MIIDVVSETVNIYIMIQSRTYKNNFIFVVDYRKMPSEREIYKV